MSNIIQFPMPEFTPTPITPDAMMDFALAWDIDTEEELIALNEWMVKLIQALNDLDQNRDTTQTLYQQGTYENPYKPFIFNDLQKGNW